MFGYPELRIKAFSKRLVLPVRNAITGILIILIFIHYCGMLDMTHFLVNLCSLMINI